MKNISIMPHRKRLITIVVTLFTIIVAGIVIFYKFGGYKNYRERAERKKLFLELKTVTLENCVLKRFGNDHDGGYLLCENLMRDVTSAYSYGIGGTDVWGCDVSKEYRLPVHQYDCFNVSEPICEGGDFIFHRECIGDKNIAFQNKCYDTLNNQIIRNEDEKKRLVVKMDVEGAEWDAILATPDDVLNNIDQLIVEFHMGHQAAINPESAKTGQIIVEFHKDDLGKFIKVIKKLKNMFYLVHVHYNNSTCYNEISPFPAWCFEVLFVNKRIGKPDKRAPAFPKYQPLDAPNDPASIDCQYYKK
jgi:hypothetical protein